MTDPKLTWPRAGVVVAATVHSLVNLAGMAALLIGGVS